MRLLIVVFLHIWLFSRANQSVLTPSEVFAPVKGGFPTGSLLTIFLKRPSSYGIRVDLREYEHEHPSNDPARLHFRIDGPEKMRELISNVKVDGTGWGIKDNSSNYVVPGAETDEWWRFDIYKINDTHFLPFIQGFHAGIRNMVHPATMTTVKTVTSVHIRSTIENITVPTFDKNDVYMTRRLPNANSPKPGVVEAAFDQLAIVADRAKRTEFMKLDNFPVRSKIKLSALMLSNPSNYANKDMDIDRNYAALFFFSQDGKWAFGICNKWKGDEKKVKLHLIASKDIPAPMMHISALNTSSDCTGTTSSSDIVHVKLVRPDKNTIKMYIYYKGSPGGISCKITVGDDEATLLDKPLTIKGAQSGTLLHIKQIFPAK